MMPAEGVASRPSCTRQRSRKVVMICSHTPSRAKASKIRIHSGFRRVLTRDHAPGAASSQHVKDPIKDRSHLHFSWSSTWLLRGNEWFENGPLCIGEVR